MRTEKIQVVLSPEEKRTIAQLASRYGLSMGATFRMLAAERTAELAEKKAAA